MQSDGGLTPMDKYVCVSMAENVVYVLCIRICACIGSSARGLFCRDQRAVW